MSTSDQGNPQDPESSTTTTKPQQPVTVPCKYRTGPTLGTGSRGVVKEAVHIKTGKRYACKVINKKSVKGIEHTVHNEIAVLKRVSNGHLNVVTLHDYFETMHNLYFCLDLCAGGELLDSIHARRRYTDADASDLVRTILDAVKYIHDRGIVHRNLKPEHLVFRSRPEKASEIMITGFGHSHIMPDNKLLTGTSGTLRYMAPEIFKEAGHGMPVDIWAIGVITYLLLSGSVPFRRDTRQEEIGAILAGDYSFDPKGWHNVSETARKFVSTCLTMDPATRPTAKEMLRHPWLQEYEIFETFIVF